MQQHTDWTKISANYIRRNLSSQQYREAMLQELMKHISFEAYCCTLVDPVSLLSIGSVTEASIEQIHHKIISYEYGHDDEISYEQMIQSDITVSILSEATNGNMKHSKRYAEILAPAGFSDEARVLLISGGQCWGYLTLFKQASSISPYFQQNDKQLLTLIAPVIGAALKQYHHYIIDEPIIARSAARGIIVLTEQLQLLAMNAQGKQLLIMLQQHERIGLESASAIQRQPSLNDSAAYDTDQMNSFTDVVQELPKPIQTLAHKLLAQKIDESYTLLVPVPMVGYITVSATQLITAAGQKELAIHIDAASANEMLAFLMEAYKLTAREQEIVYELIKGSSTKEIATQLSLSAYTVSDHLKSIYTKLNVSSRNEVIWKLYSKFQVDVHEL